MYARSRKQRNIRHVALTSCFIGMVTYCCYHAISGEHGIFALISLSDKLEKSQARLDIVRAERISLEHKVALLRPNSLDLDLLDEQARKVLVYATPDEQVYLYNHHKGKNTSQAISD